MVAQAASAWRRGQEGVWAAAAQRVTSTDLQRLRWLPRPKTVTRWDVFERLLRPNVLRRRGRAMDGHLRPYLFQYICNEGNIAVYNSGELFALVCVGDDGAILTWPDWRRVVTLLPLVLALERHPRTMWHYALDPRLCAECILVNLVCRAVRVRALSDIL